MLTAPIVWVRNAFQAKPAVVKYFFNKSNLLLWRLISIVSLVRDRILWVFVYMYKSARMTGDWSSNISMIILSTLIKLWGHHPLWVEAFPGLGSGLYKDERASHVPASTIVCLLTMDKMWPAASSSCRWDCSCPGICTGRLLGSWQDSRSAVTTKSTPSGRVFFTLSRPLWSRVGKWWSYARCFSYCCLQIPSKNQLTEQSSCFGSWCERTQSVMEAKVGCWKTGDD